MEKFENNKMKKLLLFIFTVLLTLILTSCNTPATPNTPPDKNIPVTTPEQNDPVNPSGNNDVTGRTIIISDTEGNDVKMTRGEGREYDATSGTRMSNGYTALTGTASHISLLFDSESTVKTDELTKVEIEQVAEKKLSLVLLEGAIVANISPLQKDETVDFKAGNVTLGIRSTSFIMEYRNENDVIIIMLEGSGYINGETLLEAGHIAIISLHDISIEPLTTSAPLSSFALFEIEQRDDGTLLAGNTGNFVNGHPPTDLTDGFHYYEYDRGTYEGNWVNGLPNGEGTVTYPAIIADGDVIISGFLIDGLFHGEITMSTPGHPVPGGIETFVFDVDMGRQIKEQVASNSGQTLMDSTKFVYGEGVRKSL